MKRIGIITFHRADNYGAVLQSYALQKLFEQRGENVQVIDYRCEEIEKNYGCIEFPKIGYNIIAWIKRILYWRYSRELIEKKTKRFDKFRKDYLKLTEPLKSHEDRMLVGERFDLIVTGSDQVWNPNITNGVDEWYFFNDDNMNTHPKLASYAASLGNTDDFDKWFKQIRSILLGYDSISVRERSAYLYLKEKLPEKNITVNLDPTLVIAPEVWYGITNSKRIIKERYIFYYDAAQNDTAKVLAEQIANKLGLKIVHYNSTMYRTPGTIYAVDSGPIEFLNYIRHAEMVVTSSFHGTVFSLIFKKQFLAVAHPKLGGRIKDLLIQLGLENHIYVAEQEKSIELLKPIDYNITQERLNKIRLESSAFIDFLCEL